MIRLLLLVVILGSNVSSKAQINTKGEANSAASGKIQLNVMDVIWQDGSSSLPKGSKMAILEGNPKSAGMFTIRVTIPPNSLIPMHTHPKEERVTVISGNVWLGFRADMNESDEKMFSSSAFYLNPPGISHYVKTKNESAIIQITGMGPWEIHFNNSKETK